MSDNNLTMPLKRADAWHKNACGCLPNGYDLPATLWSLTCEPKHFFYQLHPNKSHRAYQIWWHVSIPPAAASLSKPTKTNCWQFIPVEKSLIIFHVSQAHQPPPPPPHICLVSQVYLFKHRKVSFITLVTKLAKSGNN